MERLLTWKKHYFATMLRTIQKSHGINIDSEDFHFKTIQI
jgi:hypothetical protein